MPANLTPQYKEAEQRYREASGHPEKLAALREMLALLPKHKGTEKLQGDLRHRIAKLEQEAAHGPKGGAARFDPGHVRHEGAGQWVLVGPPNAGKSALVRSLTHAHPEVAPYPFTTRTPLPGMMPFEDVQVQLVDSPAVAAGHCESYMTNLARSADGVLLVVDVAAEDLAESIGVLDEFLGRARFVLRGAEAPGPLDLAKPILVAGNKRDLDADGRLAARARALAAGRAFHSVSAEHGMGLEELRRALFEGLDRIRIYSKEPGHRPDLDRPFVLDRGATVGDLARKVHQDVAARLRYARIWGHARFDGQQVDRDHVLHDRDVVELHG